MTAAREGDQPVPPVAARRTAVIRQHGKTRVDPYAWLRADNWRDVLHDPARLPGEIREHLEAENAYCQTVMASAVALRARLVSEMRARIRDEDAGVPRPDGAFAYWSAYEKGAQHTRLMRGLRDGGEERCLLDGNAQAAGRGFFRLGEAVHSPDHRWLAWLSDETGGEAYILRLRDLDTGKDSDDTITGCGGEIAWTADSRNVIYIRLDEDHRPRWVYRHRLGTDPAADRLIYEEKDPGFFVSLGKTASGRFIVIDCHDHETSESHLLPADAPDAPLVTVAARRTGRRYQVEEGHGVLYILTNADGAEDFKIVTALASQPDIGNWHEVVAHEAGAPLRDFALFSGHLAWLRYVDHLPQLGIRCLQTGEEHSVSFTDQPCSVDMIHGFECDTAILRFSLESMTTPKRIFDYRMDTRVRTLRKYCAPPNGHDPADYVTCRLHAPAHDGETVPVSVLYHKDTPLDGSAPCWLYGYGAYGLAMPADFSTSRLSLTDRGVIYAIAHIRGGEEKGRRWYRQGKGRDKPNSFHDFLAVARHLVRKGFTASGRIVGHGGSAGGMVIGAAANMAPELFCALVAEVPFVDVLNTMSDDTLPLTPPEWPEWGNPASGAQDYETIAAYSPYDNIGPGAYPHILALAGVTDPRVAYWEPAKWVARLRERNTGDSVILLRTNMDAGHGGACGRFARLEETAFVQAFGLTRLGVLTGTPET